jgi:hypothetical protein
MKTVLILSFTLDAATVKEKSKFFAPSYRFQSTFLVFDILISSQNQPFLLLKKTLSKNIYNTVGA